VRAIVFERFGEPADVLSLREVPTPEPKRGEVRVRMLASPINPSDLMTVRGEYGLLPELPATPGYEGVGIVEAAGGGFLANYFRGKRVAVLNRRGGDWADYAVLPAKQVIPLAGDLLLEQAAMFFVNPATAYIMTREVLRIPRGAWLLQTAAGSSLGRMVIRLGRHFGFRTLNVVRRREQVAELQALGGDAVIAFDPARDAAGMLHEEVLQITGGRGVPFAIDPVGGGAGSAMIGCLATGGHMLVYGTLSGEPLTFSSRALMTPAATLHGFWLARWMQPLGLVAKLKLVRRVTALIRAGVLTSEVGEAFPLEEIAAAVRTAEQPARGGKVLLRIAAN
jgi:NADPH:quinone reductase-like Zn-dependent oxidoreductase